MQSVFLAVLNVVYAIFLTLVLLYIVRLQKTGCMCSKDWKREFLQYYLLVMIPIVLVVPFTGVPVWVVMLINIVNIAYLFIVFTYIRELKHKQCHCSAEPIRDVLEIVNYFQIAVLAFTFVATFAVMILLAVKKVNVPKSVKTK